MFKQEIKCCKKINLLKKAEVKRMNVNANISSWYENGGREKIQQYFKDADGIFTTANGFKKGVYGVSVVTPHAKEIRMYIGESGKEGRCIRDRLVEHAKYWIENPEFYAGVKASELKNGYSYKVRILAEEQDDDKRYAIEQSLVEEMKPYMQFSCYPKFTTDYRGYDLAIFGTYRRRAFVVARDGKYTEEAPELLVDQIFKLTNKVDFNEYKTTKPDKALINLIEKEMPNGSKVCSKIKEFVEKNMGITSERGCRYSYLVKIVAAALEPVYKTQMTL